MSVSSAQWSQKLWQPQNLFLICRTAIGLQEKVDEETKTIVKVAFVALAFVALAFCSLSVLLPISFVAARIVLSWALLGILGTAFIGYVTLSQRGKTKEWLEAFKALIEGRYSDAEQKFKNQMEKHPARFNAPDILNPLTKSELVSLDPQYGSVFDKKEGNNYYPAYRAVGHAMLLMMSRKAYMADFEGKLQELQTQEWNDYLTACEKLLDHPYHQLKDINPPEVVQALRSSNIEAFPIPMIKSPGHALLLNIYDWTREFDVNRDFNEKGELVNHQGAGLEYLKGWQNSVRKSKQWMERQKTYGSLEQSLIDPLLAAKNMRDFTKVLRTLTPSQLDALTKSMVEYYTLKK